MCASTVIPSPFSLQPLNPHPVAISWLFGVFVWGVVFNVCAYRVLLWSPGGGVRRHVSCGRAEWKRAKEQTGIL